MSVEREIERDADAEARAERVVALEEEIREAHEDTRNGGEEPDVVVDATLSRERFLDWARGGVREADVVSAERQGRRVAIRFEADGEIHERRVPFPDDPRDESEPLVRLCRRNGVDPKRVGDLDSVPIVEAGRRFKIVVPAGREHRLVEVRLPGGRRIHKRVETTDSRKRRYLQWWQRVLLRTPVLQGRPGDMEGGANRAVGSLFGFPALGLVLGLALSPLPVIGMAMFMLGIFAGIVSFVAVHDADFRDGFETY